tara:strand:- start:158 stop:283 length:126 start_codon:yes stop_codon:yes gene_type:complete
MLLKGGLALAFKHHNKLRTTIPKVFSFVNNLAQFRKPCYAT